MRVYSEEVYGIPPEQVVGTAGGTTYGWRPAFPAGRRSELDHQLVRLHVDAEDMGADEVSIR